MTEQEFVDSFVSKYGQKCAPGKTGTKCHAELDAFHDACLANAEIQDKLNGNEECISECNLGWYAVRQGTWP